MKYNTKPNVFTTKSFCAVTTEGKDASLIDMDWKCYVEMPFDLNLPG